MTRAKEFEEKIIETIQVGNLEEFKKLGTGSCDINKELSIAKQVKVVCKSGKCPFRVISEPVQSTLAVLCEQSEILDFILNNYKPNLNITKNGWNLLHFAACTGDYKCMQVLLEHEYFQENIDAPIIQNLENSPNSTTALHIAVSNHKYAQALLLLSPLPGIKFGNKNEKFEIPQKSKYQSANASQASSNSNTPLHIAARFNDIEMIKILLHFGAETEAKNKEGKTPIDLAKELNFTEAAELMMNDAGEDLYDKYIEKPADEGKKDEKEEKEEKKEEAKKENEYATKREVAALDEQLESLKSLLEQMKQRVQNLEESKKEPDFSICVQCGSLTSNKCSECGAIHCPECPHVN